MVAVLKLRLIRSPCPVNKSAWGHVLFPDHACVTLLVPTGTPLRPGILAVGRNMLVPDPPSRAAPELDTASSAQKYKHDQDNWGEMDVFSVKLRTAVGTLKQKSPTSTRF